MLISWSGTIFTTFQGELRSSGPVIAIVRHFHEQMSNDQSCAHVPYLHLLSPLLAPSLGHTLQMRSSLLVQLLADTNRVHSISSHLMCGRSSLPSRPVSVRSSCSAACEILKLASASRTPRKGQKSGRASWSVLALASSTLALSWSIAAALTCT